VPETGRPHVSFISTSQQVRIEKMKLTLTAAAALIGLAAVFGQAGAAPAASLPDETQVIQAGGRSSGGHRSGHRRGGRDFGHRGGGRSFGHRGGGRSFGHRGGRRSFGHRGGRQGFGHRGGRHGGGYGGGYGRGHGGYRGGHGYGHDNYAPYVYGGVALGTYLFLDAIDGY
jgi:hypothetical protein